LLHLLLISYCLFLWLLFYVSAMFAGFFLKYRFVFIRG
jgi:hypothetical protein